MRAPFAIFPCNGKVPLTPHGCKDATTDREQIRQWEDRWPACNWAIATGSASGGLLVVDVDGIWEQPGAEWTRIVNECGLNGHGGLRTVTVLSGSGHSMHWYFMLPSGVTLGNSTGRLAPGIDTRGEGGYVICPPSSHPEGGRYVWVMAPDECGIVELPAGLLERLQPPPAPRHAPRPVRVAAETDPVARRILDEECDRVARAGEGTRNATAFAAAASIGNIVAGGELVLGDAANALLSAALASGLPRDEAEAVVANGLEAGMATPRRIRTRGGAR